VDPGYLDVHPRQRAPPQVPAASAKGALEEGAGVRSPQVERNNFKCPRCHKAHHPQNSPLVLCDSCPRSYHLVCLDLKYEELPLREWSCPKCVDRKNGVGGRRGAAGSLGRSEAYERCFLPLFKFVRVLPPAVFLFF